MAQHPLLRHQLDRAKGALTTADLSTLISMVNGAYQEHDQDRRRVDRANNLMAEELETLNSDLHGAVQALELQNLRFQAALNNMSHGLCLFDRDGCLVVCNRRFLDLYGLSPDAAPVGAALAEIIGMSPALRQATQVARRALIAEHVDLGVGGAASLEQAWPDGRILHIVRDHVEDGGYIDTIADIIEGRQASAKIAHMARHDALTDLPNRVLLRERLLEAISGARCGELSAVLYLDLDRFKSVNDTLGHPIGDALLIAVTGRLRAQVRTGDTVARLGGDEFAIIQRQINDADETQVLGKRIIQAISEPYSLSGHKIHIGASIGIELIKGMYVDPDEVMRNADVALYKAKAEGRGCFRSFDPELHSVLGKRRLTETNLRRAITDPNAFEIHYQPQFDIKTNSVTGFEALVRWRDPVRGLIPPSEFIGVAEETGLIDKIGHFVLERACEDALSWPDHVSVAVNLSAVQFKTSRVAEVVVAALDRTGLPPRRIDLEITETVMLEDDKRAICTLSHLKRLGARISLDDFGTGFSSLSFLRRFPFDRIKIDQSFVRDMADNAGSMAIIRAVISICRSMGIDSIAEGIETPEQLAWLAKEGCDSVQGYLLGRPMKLADATALFAPRPRPMLRAVAG